MIGTFIRKHKTQIVLWSVLAALIGIVYRQAFTLQYFMDDFFFIKISRVSDIGEFFQFFNPFRDYFYRPISTEFFYFILSLFDYNRVVAHSIVFVVFLTGLFFLYQSTRFFTKDRLFPALAVVLYAFHLVHVFQLYWLATAQEVFLFTFLSTSFFAYLRKKYLISTVLFLCALLSKETAIMYPIALIILELARYLWQYTDRIHDIPHTLRKTDWKTKVITEQRFRILGMFIGVSILFFLIYRFAITSVTDIDIYQIQYSPRLAFNNLVWYILWSLGFPSYMPDYISSFFLPPIPDFWKTFFSPEAQWYFYSLLLFYALFISTTLTFLVFFKKKRPLLIFTIITGFMLFVVFILPTLPIIHRWMVRLTVPMIATSTILALVLSWGLKEKGLFRVLAGTMILLYGIFQYFGIRIHQEASTYLLSHRIVTRVERIFEQHGEEIRTKDRIYFIDTPNTTDASWGGHEKIRVAFHDQSFLDYFFPGEDIEAIYGDHTTEILPNSYVIKSQQLFHDTPPEENSPQ
jgi:hypothetical protein